MIVVTSRLTGETHRHPVLELADGSRYLLRDGGALTTGATVAIRGRADGRALFVQSTRQIAAPPSAQALRNAAPQRKELTGTLRMFHIDYEDGPADFGYSLVTDAGQQNIVELGTLLPQLENGMRATVSGPVDARGYVAVDSIDHPGAADTKASSDGASASGMVGARGGDHQLHHAADQVPEQRRRTVHLRRRSGILADRHHHHHACSAPRRRKASPSTTRRCPSARS